MASGETPTWSTACPDWERRIVAKESLIPFSPLFPAEAAASMDIFRELRIVDAPGSPKMEQAARPWLFDFASTIFGAYDPESGRRLIRYFFLLISKKNVKSTGAAAIMVTALLRNWRESGEFAILAPTMEIANNSFAPARDMVYADDSLRSVLHVNASTRTILHRNTGATLKIVAADSETVGGKKSIGVLVDELWLFGKRRDAENMLREATGGLASRPEGFVIFLSTQSDDPPAGIFAQKLDEFRAIRDGKITDPRSLPVLYEFPAKMVQEKAYEDPANFYITNPNLGASVDPEFLSDEFAKAKFAGAKSLTGFFAKHLNIQIGMALRANAWAGAAVWPRGVENGLTLDMVLDRSEVVTVGIDGGGLDDLLGIGVIGREKGTKRWLAWTHALVSPEGLERRKENITLYEQFEKDGDLTVVEQLPDDITRVVDIVRRVKERQLLAQAGVDAAGIGAIVDALAEIGVAQHETPTEDDQLVAIRQGISLMGAIKTVERKLADRSFRHGGQRMMNWCASNAVVVPTPTAMRIARDEAGYGKIDPLMALFNAAALMQLNPAAMGASVYEERGLLVL